MTKSTKSAKIVLTLLFALLICVAVAVVGTYSALQASKTATGTVTFNLADYDVSIDDNVTFTGNIYPGYSANSGDIRIVNSHETTSGGATEGLGPVYVAIKINSITVGDNSMTVKCATTSTSGYITLSTANGLEIRLRASAEGTGGLTWAADGSDVSKSRINLQGTLPFTEREDISTGPAAVMQFQVAMAEPTDVNNGFNSDTTGNPVNQYQGKSVSISYTIYWGTTEANLNSVYPTA